MGHQKMLQWVGFSSVLLAFSSMLACDKSSDGQAAAEASRAPLLGALELPVSLRRGDTASPDAVRVEIGPSELRAAGQSIVTLEGGVVPVSAMQGPAIKALQPLLSGKSAVTIELHASTPYRTVGQVLGTAGAAGVTAAAFKVRGNGAPDQLGHLAARFTVGPRSADDAVPDPATSSHRSWSDFVAAWQQVGEGCQQAQSGNCAYKPEAVAEGGDLKVVLYAAGDGVNVNYFRVGAEPAAIEPAAGKPSGDGAKATDPAAQAEAEVPATQALYQFRSREAVTDPSPVTATVRPVCGGHTCRVVVRAQAKTMAARVLSLVGAAFPDGAAAPELHFEI